MSATTEYWANAAELKLSYLKDVIDTNRHGSADPNRYSGFLDGGVTLSYDTGLYGVVVERALGADVEYPGTEADLDENPVVVADGVLTFGDDLEVRRASYDVSGRLSGEGLVSLTVDIPMEVEGPFQNSFVIMIAGIVEAEVETAE